MVVVFKLAGVLVKVLAVSPPAVRWPLLIVICALAACGGAMYLNGWLRRPAASQDALAPSVSRPLPGADPRAVEPR